MLRLIIKCRAIQIQDHYESIASKLPPFAMPLLVDIAVGDCSLEHLKQVEAFFTQPQHQADATAARLAQVGEKVRACAMLRRREGQSVISAFSATERFALGPSVMH